MKPLFLLLALALLTGCTVNDRATIKSELSVTSNGVTTLWTSACEEHEYSCNYNTISNSRSMFLGNDLYYVCGVNNQLYTYVGTYRARSALTPITGASCKYSIVRVQKETLR